MDMQLDRGYSNKTDVLVFVVQIENSILNDLSPIVNGKMVSYSIAFRITISMIHFIREPGLLQNNRRIFHKINFHLHPKIIG